MRIQALSTLTDHDLVSNYPHALPIFACFENVDSSVHIVMPLYRRGDLTKAGALPERTARNIAAQVADCLEAMHAKGLVHRDIKRHNLLMDDSFEDSGRIVVADFGFVTPVSKGTTRCRGTLDYMAPEIGTSESPTQALTTACDIFALGVLLVAMVLGREPTSRLGFLELAGGSVAEYVPQLLAGVTPPVSGEYAAIALAALRRDPAARPSAADMSGWLRKLRPGPPPVPLPRASAPAPAHSPASAVSASASASAASASASASVSPVVSTHASRSDPALASASASASASTAAFSGSSHPPPAPGPEGRASAHSPASLSSSHPPPAGAPAHSPTSAVSASSSHPPPATGPEGPVLAALQRRDVAAGGASFDEAVRGYLASDAWRAAMAEGRGALVVGAMAKAAACDGAWAAVAAALTTVVQSEECRRAMGVEGVRDAVFRAGIAAKGEGAMGAVAGVIAERLADPATLGVVGCVVVREVLVRIGGLARSTPTRAAVAAALFSLAKAGPEMRALVEDEAVRDVLVAVWDTAPDAAAVRRAVSSALMNLGEAHAIMAVPAVRDVLVSGGALAGDHLSRLLVAAAVVSLAGCDAGRRMFATEPTRDMLVALGERATSDDLCHLVAEAMAQIARTEEGREVLAAEAVRGVLVAIGGRTSFCATKECVVRAVGDIAATAAGLRVMRTAAVRELMAAVGSEVDAKLAAAVLSRLG